MKNIGVVSYDLEDFLLWRYRYDNSYYDDGNMYHCISNTNAIENLNLDAITETENAEDNDQYWRIMDNAKLMLK